MNKPLRTALLCLLVIGLLFTASCNEDDAPTEPPTPTEIRQEKADNAIEARYTFTLRQLTDMLNEADDDSGDSDNTVLRYDSWQILSTELVDDRGVAYSSYYYPMGAVTLTAAVENDSQEVFNIGCGCDRERLDDPEYRTDFVRLAALIAAKAGGYADADTTFLGGIFNTLLDTDETQLYYERGLYILSEDADSVVLMMSPYDGLNAADRGIHAYTPPADAETIAKEAEYGKETSNDTGSGTTL